MKKKQNSVKVMTIAQDKKKDPKAAQKLRMASRGLKVKISGGLKVIRLVLH